jgi:hypothetical protein
MFSILQILLLLFIVPWQISVVILIVQNYFLYLDTDDEILFFGGDEELMQHSD